MSSLWVLSVAPLATGVWAAPAISNARHTEAALPAAERPVPTSSSAASADPFRAVGLSPLEKALFADAADGRWDEHSLLRAALIASGVNSAHALRRYELRMKKLAEQLEQSGRVAGSPRRTAQVVLELLHQRVLHDRYEADCTDLSVALDEGRFNCVSATVLFHWLADRVGLETRSLETSGHVMSRVMLAGAALDVETTRPDSFRLKAKPEKPEPRSDGNLGPQASPETSAAGPSEVTAVGLVAMIYYNQGIDLLGQGQFAPAAAANVKALRLDPSSSTARGNLLATVNNWAIHLSGAGRHEEAIGLLRQGVAFDPSYEPFQANYTYVHHQRIETLCHQRRFPEALNLIVRAEADAVDEAYFPSARLHVYRRWARSCFESGRTDRAFALFEEALARHHDVAEAREAEVAEVNRQAKTLFRQRRYAEAVDLLDRAFVRQPGSAVLAANRRAAVMRWAEPAFHEGDYAEAIRRTTHGAAPGRLHATLAGNVRYGYYQWISRLVADGRHAEARRIAHRATTDPYLAGRVDGAIPRALGKRL
ncbi:MAG: tetratricopeptide repeat protein [Planctomycetota bacterium]